MKKAAISAAVLTAVLLGVFLYGLANAKLHLRPLAPQVISAAQQPQEFVRLHTALQDRSLIGTLFQQSMEGEAGEYSLIVYPVEVTNRGLVEAQMAEVIVSPTPQDVLCYTDGSAQGEVPVVNIAPGETRTIRCVLLTRNGQRLDAVRDLHVSYHVWGNPFTLRTISPQASTGG